MAYYLFFFRNEIDRQTIFADLYRVAAAFLTDAGQWELVCLLDLVDGHMDDLIGRFIHRYIIERGVSFH